MRFRFLSLAAALALSACAQPAMLGSLTDCDGPAAPDPNATFTDLSHGLSTRGIATAYDPMASRLSPKRSSCARSQPAPSMHDLNKVGAAPGGSQTASARPCPANRA